MWGSVVGEQRGGHFPFRWRPIDQLSHADPSPDAVVADAPTSFTRLFLFSGEGALQRDVQFRSLALSNMRSLFEQRAPSIEHRAPSVVLSCQRRSGAHHSFSTKGDQWQPMQWCTYGGTVTLVMLEDVPVDSLRLDGWAPSGQHGAAVRARMQRSCSSASLDAQTYMAFPNTWS